jgi:hypothetical protein
MHEKELTEADIRTKFITPALVGADGGKWNVMTQLREEVYFTRGRVIVRGKTVKRGEARKVDYISQSHRPLCEDDCFLRQRRPRRARAAGAGQRQPGPRWRQQ